MGNREGLHHPTETPELANTYHVCWHPSVIHSGLALLSSPALFPSSEPQSSSEPRAPAIPSHTSVWAYHLKLCFHAFSMLFLKYRHSSRICSFLLPSFFSGASETVSSDGNGGSISDFPGTVSHPDSRDILCLQSGFYSWEPE